MVKLKTPVKQKVKSLHAHTLAHSDVSDRVVIVMLIAVVVISLLSLGLYLYTSTQDSSAMVTGQAVAQEAPSQGVISLEILPQPKVVDHNE